MKSRGVRFSFSLAGWILFFGATTAASADPIPPNQWTGKTPVAELLFFLGEKRPAHFVESPSPDRILSGERLVRKGQLRDAGGAATPRLSHYFRCIDCHNTVREDPDLSRISNPDTKLAFAIEKKIPLLQGSSFAGMVNRESWYNDDYAKKYRFSVSVRAARSNLQKAIELCCTQCSQGRKPEKWEIEALLAYFWSLQWTVGDLNLTGEELADWKRRALKKNERKKLVAEIKSRYPLKSPATFGKPPEEAKDGFPLSKEPDPAIGKKVFQVSCLHCHDPAEGAAETYFRDDEKTRSLLSRKFKSNSKKSAYGFIRLGTHPENEQRLYMPNYTRERLSDFHIESLRAYLSGE